MNIWRRIVPALVFLVYCNFTFALTMGEVVAMLREDPEKIAEEQLTREIEIYIKYGYDDELRMLVNEISEIPANSIRRSTLKKHYLPLELKILEQAIKENPILSEIGMGREINLEESRARIDTVKGKEIINDHLFIMEITKAVYNLKNVDELMPLLYGDAYFVENGLWHETPYMEKLQPLPIERLEYATGKKAENYSHFWDILSEYMTLKVMDEKQIEAYLKCLHYLPSGPFARISGQIANILINRFSMEEARSKMSYIWNDMLVESGHSDLSVLIDYQMNKVVGLWADNHFISYCDSLERAGVEYAYKLPFEYSAKYVDDEEFRKYRKGFRGMIYLILFCANESNYSHLMPPYKFNMLSFRDFIKAASAEIFDFFYAEKGMEAMALLDLLYDRIITSSIDENFGGIILELAGAYSMINAIKSCEILRYYGIDRHWASKNMDNPEEIENWDIFLRVASTLALVEADLLNYLRHDFIRELLTFIGDNIGKACQESRERISYDMAWAYYMIRDFDESRRWNPIESEEYREEARKLDFSIACHLEDKEKILHYLRENKDLAFPAELEALGFLFKVRDDEFIEALVDFFRARSRRSIYDVIFMEPNDQEWSLIRNRGLVNSALQDLASEYWISQWMITEGGDNMDFNKANNHFISELMYDWALLSKGALMRSRNEIKEKFMSRLTPEQMKAYQSVGELFSLDKSDVHSADYILRKYANSMLLDMVRDDAPEYSGIQDYSFKTVRAQLGDNDVAVEFLDLFGEYYALLIRKNIDSPVLSLISYGDEEIERMTDGTQVWKWMEEYLVEGDRIIYSTDGGLNLINLDLISDNEGNPIFDKYEFVRVTSTLNIPEKQDREDLVTATIFANLEYSEELSYEKMYGAAYSGLPIMYWEPLPDSEYEIDCIQRHYIDENLKIYRGIDGDKAAFLNMDGNSPNLLHIATHAFFWPYEEKEDGTESGPMERSAVVLAGSEPDFYYSRESKSIFSSEIAKMDLRNVGLLVLSACDGARGNLSIDGVEGLQRGFKQSGVKSIIMSLGKVGSAEITRFMDDFYNSLKEDNDTRNAFTLARKEAARRNPDGTWKLLIYLD